MPLALVQSASPAIHLESCSDTTQYIIDRKHIMASHHYLCILKHLRAYRWR